MCVHESCCEKSKFEETVWTSEGSSCKVHAKLLAIEGSPYFGCEGM